MSQRPVVIVSNRGPVSYRQVDGELVATRGAGGLVSGLAPVVAGTDALWLAAAMSDGDRQAAAQGVTEAHGLRVRLLDIDPATFNLAYDEVCNTVLWYAYHGLFDLPRRPAIGRSWHRAWAAYRAVNQAFADAIAADAPQGAAVLVQDYHLALVADAIGDRRPDLRLIHFSHTPFCQPDGLAPLPDGGAELLGAMARFDACGFHTPRWADAFRACLDQRGPGASSVEVFVSPLAADAADLAATAEGEAAGRARAQLVEQVGDRSLLVRVDRIELSKNVLRGFEAYDLLLDEHPELRRRVTFVALLYPSRLGVDDYAAYGRDVAAAAAALNERWGTPDWTPVLYDGEDDFPRSIAALQLADVVLVNPVRDGLNLVAKEQALVNRNDAVLVLSHEAGAWAELASSGAIGINPFDVGATADALHQALTMDRAERARRAAGVRAVAVARTPADWLADQLAR